MSKSLKRILIILYCFDTCAADDFKTGLPFPHLSDFDVEDMKKPVYKFPGVDYEQLPPKLKEEYSKLTSCHGEHLKCIESMQIHNPVCGYDTRYWWYKSYHSLCALEYDNCQEMKNRPIGMYGKDYRDRAVYFIGEGERCELFMRRQGLMQQTPMPMIADLKK